MNSSSNGPRGIQGKLQSDTGSGGSQYASSSGTLTVQKDKIPVEKEAEGMLAKAEHMAGAVVDKAEHMAGAVKDKAEHMASAVKDKAGELGDNVSDSANAAVTSVGEAISSLGGSVRAHSPTALAPYAEKAATSMEQAGSYLQKSNIGDMVDDMAGVVRRHPMPSILAGVLFGFLLARKIQR